MFFCSHMYLYMHTYFFTLKNKYIQQSAGKSFSRLFLTHRCQLARAHDRLFAELRPLCNLSCGTALNLMDARRETEHKSWHMSDLNTCVSATIGTYIPSCDEDGYYKRLQCDQSKEECWCVDQHGEELMGSRIHGNTDCGEHTMCRHTNTHPELTRPPLLQRLRYTRPSVTPLTEDQVLHSLDQVHYHSKRAVVALKIKVSKINYYWLWWTCRW